MIRCMLVDDNKMARMALRQLISQVKELELMSECESAMEAYNAIQSTKIDLLFLDIEMPGVTGLELAKQLKDARVNRVGKTAALKYRTPLPKTMRIHLTSATTDKGKGTRISTRKRKQSGKRKSTRRNSVSLFRNLF